MTRLIGFSALVVSLLIDATVFSFDSQSALGASAGVGTVVLTFAIKALALWLIFARDREDFRGQAASHRGKISGALLKLRSFNEDDHADAQDVLNNEHRERLLIINLGYYGYARGYALWALFFVGAAILVVTTL